ncbi:MAG: RpiB/LacA/LacB family sugar-phosphate isomerase [Erysipelotrichaceae bacterium]|nr:RpiB/LacA/LacB family sugar-phosphate isomerase [Erysipelotrichaceae bacterium]
MRIAIGCDEAAYDLKEAIKQYLNTKDCTLVDVGTYDKNPVLYPDIAEKVCNEILNNNCERGILFCGTGIGMSITANKIPGIRAAVVHDIFSLERMIKSNDCQIICMGSRIIAQQTAEFLLDRWLKIKFIDSPSTEKINRIKQIENKYNNVR